MPTVSTNTRVLIVSATPLAGTWATSELMASLFPSFDRSGLAQVIASREDIATQDIATSTVDGGIRTPWDLRRQWNRVEEFARDHRPEVIYFRSAGWPLGLESVPLRLRNRLGIPIVTHVMDDWPTDLVGRRPRVGAAAARLLSATLKVSAQRLVISPSMASAYQNRYGGDFTVVHNGVEADEWVTVGSTDLDGPYVMYAGGSASNQSDAAIDDLLEAFADVHEQRPELRLVVAARNRQTLGPASPPWLVAADLVDRPTYLARLAGAEALLMLYNFDEDSKRFMRYSLANKIGDCLGARTPTVVYGPSGIATVDAAVAGGWAEVVTTRDAAELGKAVLRVLDDESRRQSVLAAAAVAAAGDFSIVGSRERFLAALTGATAAG